MADDFVKAVIDKFKRLLPGVSDDQLKKIEDEIRTEWGGEEPYIAKKKISDEKKREAVNQYIGGKPVEVIRKKTGVSRATMYRHLKK